MDWSGGAWGSGENVSDQTSQDNESLTCFYRMSEEPPYSSSFIEPVRALQAAAFLIICTLGISLNVLVIYLVAKYKSLQTQSFGIAVQISVVNLLASILHFSGFISAVANGWVLGEYLCAGAGMLLYSVSNIRGLLIFVFVVNRFLFVFMPFSYPKYHGKVILLLSLLIWLPTVLGSFLLIPPILDCLVFDSRSLLCTSSNLCGVDCSLFSSTNYTLIAIPTTIIPTILYIALFVKAKKLKKETATIAAGMDETSRRDWKATITFFFLFVSVFATTLPSITVNFILRRVYGEDNVPPAAFAASVVCVQVLALITVIDPIVIMRNQDVREVLYGIKVKLAARLCAQCKKKSNDAHAVSDNVRQQTKESEM